MALFMGCLNDADDFNARIAPTVKPAVDIDCGEQHGNGALPPRVAKAIAAGAVKRRWEGDADGLDDPSRSAIAQSLACLLVARHIPAPDIEAGLRAWCDKHAYEEKGSRDDWIRGTVLKAHDFVASRNTKTSENAAPEPPAAKSGPDALADTWRVLTDPTPVPMYRVGPSWLGRLPQGGLVRGRADVIGGQPGIGKSALANVIATETLRTNPDARVVIALAEMNARQFLFRTIARIAAVPLKWLYAGAWASDPDMDLSVREARKTVAQIAGRMTFLEPPVSVGAIRRCVEDVGATILLVDYLQLVRPDQQHQNRRDAVDAVLAGILGITHRYSTATLIMASVNRNQNEKAKYGAGRDLGSFKESGNIEFSADSAFLLEPDQKFDDEFLEAKTVQLKLRCLKSRHDQARHLRCEFNRPIQAFTGKDYAGDV